jgi:hypothetical protein
MPTVIELKAKLRRWGLPVSGKKADLTSRVNTALREESFKRF